MLAAYIVGLIVGGVLVLLSVLGAGHGHDGDFGHGVEVSHDTDLGHDADVHADSDSGGNGHDGLHAHDSWIPFLSLRFWTYFFAVGGGVGVALSNFGGLKEPTIAYLSLPSGFLTGFLVAWTMHAVRRGEVDSSTNEKDLLGKAAKVTVALRSGLPGRVRCTVKGDILDLLALPESGEDIAIDSEVVIVGIEGNFAKVVPMSNILE